MTQFIEKLHRDGDNQKTSAVYESGQWVTPVKLTNGLPTGSNAIGTVGVTALPSLPAGANNIGKVEVTAIPSVTVSTMPNVTIGTMPNVTIASIPNITVASMPNVNIATMPGYDSVQDGFRQVKGYRYENVMPNVSVGAGLEYPIMIDIAGYSQVFIMATGTDTFDLESEPSPDGSYVMDRESLATAVAANTGVSKKVNNLAPYINVILTNTSAGAANYTVWVYGV